MIFVVVDKNGNYFLSLFCNSLYNVLPFSQPSFLFFPSFISILFCFLFPIITTLAKELVISLIFFFFLLAHSTARRDLSSWTKDGTRAPSSESSVLTTEPPWKFLIASRAAQRAVFNPAFSCLWMPYMHLSKPLLKLKPDHECHCPANEHSGVPTVNSWK